MPNTPLPGTVQQAPAGLSGFDVNSILSDAGAQHLKDAGYHFCIRYVPRNDANKAGNLTNAEALRILNAGLALMAVQHVANDGWKPTADLGTEYGSYAATYVNEVVGLPQGINIWLDLEGADPGSDPADVIAYCNAWYNAVHATGYVPGVYVGWHAILTSTQLYKDLHFQHYWRAYNGPEVATRGFQLIQTTEKTVSGITIDPNTTHTDAKGGNAFWLSV